MGGRHWSLTLTLLQNELCIKSTIRTAEKKALAKFLDCKENWYDYEILLNYVLSDVLMGYQKM